jgi:hypothetical protein
MLTYQDCLGLANLSAEEAAAIAEHEHIPAICAVEFGSYMVQGDNGVPKLKAIIVDDLHAAEQKGDEEHANKLRLVLWHFVETHPENPKNR